MKSFMGWKVIQIKVNGDTYGFLRLRGGINKFVDKSYTFSLFFTFLNLKPPYTLGICTEQKCVI